MVYEVYAGGINAVSGEMEVESIAPDRYNISFSAFTKGLLGRLAPWRGVFETDGWQGKDGMGKPQLHRSVAIWRGEEDIKEYRYNRKGDFLGYKAIEKNKTEDKIRDASLTTGTMDVMTATFNAMERVAQGQSCDGESEIFDGSRRFTLIFRYEADEDLKASRYNVYEGPSQRCIAEVKKGPGKWHNKPRGWISIQEQGRQRGGLPTIWFAKLSAGGPAIPVKVRIKSDYGAMFMHLIRYQNGDKVLNAEVLAGIRAENAKAEGAKPR